MGELIDRVGTDSSHLSERILTAFRAAAFGNSYTFHPSQLPTASREDTERFLAFLAAPEGQAAQELGNARARQGLGLAAVLALGRILRQFCLEVSHSDGASQSMAAIATVDRYMDAYLTGYFQGREADLLLEQERTRKAYFASLYGRPEGSTGSGGSTGAG